VTVRAEIVNPQRGKLAAYFLTYCQPPLRPTGVTLRASLVLAG